MLSGSPEITPSVRRYFLLLCSLILLGILLVPPLLADAGVNTHSTGTATATTTTTATATVEATGTSGSTAVPTSSPVPSAQPGDWPMYGHDPQRTGYNPDEALLSAAVVHRLTRAWSANIGLAPSLYQAFSAPSVADGKVFVASSVISGSNFFAFDAITGAPQWSRYIGRNPHECFGVGIGSTPAISGSLVVIGGGDSAYYALSTTDGSQAWRDPLDAGLSAFAWTSPLLVNGRAYVGVASNCDNPSVRGEVRSLHLLTGEHIATTYIVPKDEAGGGVWNSLAVSPDGSKLVVVTGEDYGGYDGPLNRAMVVMDAGTLSVLASNKVGTPGIDQDWASTPVIFHDRTGRMLVGAVHKNHVFYAYDLANVGAGPVWSIPVGTEVGLPPAYDPTLGDGGTLFFNTAQLILAVDPTDGSRRWYSTFVGVGAGNFAIANDLIYINYMGSLKIISAVNGVLLRTITPPTGSAPSSSGPVISHGMVYWVSGAYLNAWGIAPVADCPLTFNDVPEGSTFYPYVHCLACAGVVSGYANGTFRPNYPVTRGQTAKMVSLGAGFSGNTGAQYFEDVPPVSTFYSYTQYLAVRNIVLGYPCGGPGEPCVEPGNRPYFRPNTTITRAEIAKIVALSAQLHTSAGGPLFQDVPSTSAFYLYIHQLADAGTLAGYECGGPGEPCGPDNLPYFRPYNSATRGQVSKVISLTFFPDCADRKNR